MRRPAGIAVVIGGLLAPAVSEGAFPGSNGRIFFDTGGGGEPRRIASVDPQGGERNRVTNGIEPAVSPDGKRIAFVQGGDLYTADRTGGDEVRVTKTDAVERTPSFSPSGNKLVFATDFHEGQSGDIFTIGVDGKDRTRLRASDRADFTPSYSPNGNKIVFATALRLPASTQIVKMDADGSNLDLLTFEKTLSEQPTWSPDGNRIAFQRYVDGDVSIYSMEPDGSDLIQVTTGTRDREPSYSPSGNKIVYRSRISDDEGSALFAVPALGGPAEKLTASRQSGVDTDPYWGSTP
jgi:TolB protein